MNETYEDLAARAERGELTVEPGTVRRGGAARREAVAALMKATGATTPREAVRLGKGRPRVGAERGPSPVLRARVPQELKDDVRALARREHRDESEIVREAVAAYVHARHAS